MRGLGPPSGVKEGMRIDNTYPLKRSGQDGSEFQPRCYSYHNPHGPDAVGTGGGSDYELNKIMIIEVDHERT